MSALRKATSGALRSSFPMPAKELVSWYPGHMQRGMNRIQHHLKLVDCILEVHDSRIPFTGRNSSFAHRIRLKPRILLLTHADLSTLSSKQAEFVRDKLMAEEEGLADVLLVNARADKDRPLRDIVSKAVRAVDAGERFHRQFAPDYSLLVCGIPNVGKSSVINALRRIYMARKKNKVAAVGATPGVTRAVMEKVKIVDFPPVYLYDTPGILPPSVRCVHTGMTLTMFDYCKPSLDLDLIADYTLFFLNRHGCHDYVGRYGLPGVTDDITQVLERIGQMKDYRVVRRNHRNEREETYDYHAASRAFLTDFRRGKIFRQCADPLDEMMRSASEAKSKPSNEKFLGDFSHQLSSG